jgi:predicted peptidase
MILLALAALLLQDPAAQMEARVHKGALPYRLYAAKGDGKLPLLVFLHGAGERGDDNAAQLKNCVKHFMKQQSVQPFHLVAPQCPKNRRWVEVDWGAASHATPAQPSEPMGLLLDLLPALLKELDVDPKRVYVTGLSMGGFGTWDLLGRRPDLFAAGVPVCGGGDEAQAARIAKIPQRIYHGDKDNVVKTDRSRNMAAALKKAGGEPVYTEYPGVGHNCWDKAYADAALWPWLFAQKRP